MADVSAQIYVASATMPYEDRSSLRPSAKRPTEASSGSRWRFNRSTTNLREAALRSPSVSQAPAANPPVPKLERASSKMSLFNLFSRPKVERARGHIEVGLAVPMRPQTPPKPAPISTPKSSLRQNPSPPAQQTIRARSSQMFRPMSMRPPPPQKEFGTWDPPPLFQAFPQSLKHATVQACVFPPEILMRTQSQRRQAEMMRERMDSVRDLSTIAENSSESKKLEKNHRRLMSNSVLNPTMPELVNKIYILVTAGYVLQYAGEGTFDRTPEKVLKLGKESAAFACDLIPGKHWVLQISSHAHDDGTFETGPKNSLLSRLRSQNATIRTAATSFLLVLESAEEMEAWMSTVRKEIDNLGGMKAKDDSMRESSSTERSTEKSSTETSHRYKVQRDPNAVSKIVPVDSTHQSQYSDSPRIVTSEWETQPSERSASAADSIGGNSSRWGNNRQSVEMSSVASTPVSQHQVQLDQLRGRSRFSFMSSATSTSGAGTRNTSRESSPGPQSPLKESFTPVGEAEPLRSAMSLKSFHMNPSNSVASRRRSMQPLPVTNENFAPAESMPVKKQRHSLYSPTSPTVPELGRPFAASPSLPLQPKSTNTIPHIADAARSSPPQKLAEIAALQPETEVPTREDSPVRVDARTYSIPPRRDVISPPPKEPAPLPPPPAQRQSVIGMLPAPSTQQMSLFPSLTSETRTQRRISASPKPFLRPFPVRPQAQHTDGSMAVPRRQSSLTPTSAPAPLPFAINVNRSVTAPVRPPSAASMSPSTTLHSAHHPSQPLRRPTSVQIRSDPAPFLSSSRPVRAISSTPSFVPGRRASNATSTQQPTARPLQSPPSIDALRQQALAQQTQQRNVVPRRSMPALGLPPPAPPPNVPLPTLPLGLPTSAPPSMALPTPPPRVPLPALPPTMPLPPTPTPHMAAAAAASKSVVV